MAYWPVAKATPDIRSFQSNPRPSASPPPRLSPEVKELSSKYGLVPFVLRTEDDKLVVTRAEQEEEGEGEKRGMVVGDKIELIQGMSTKGERNDTVVFTTK